MAVAVRLGRGEREREREKRRKEEKGIEALEHGLSNASRRGLTRLGPFALLNPFYPVVAATMARASFCSNPLRCNGRGRGTGLSFQDWRYSQLH